MQAPIGHEASPLSIFDQALTLGDGSPMSPCAADGLTPGITPEQTGRKPRHGSRLNRATQAAKAADDGPRMPGVTSPGIAAFLREQTLADTARREAHITGGGACGAAVGPPGLPKAQPAAATAGTGARYAAAQPPAGPTDLVASEGLAAGVATSRQSLQEPAMCLTPPRSQRPPVAGIEPEAADVRLNRARAAMPPYAGASKSSLSLDRTSSFSRSSSGSAFSRASSLNDAKVRSLDLVPESEPARLCPIGGHKSAVLMRRPQPTSGRWLECRWRKIIVA